MRSVNPYYKPLISSEKRYNHVYGGAGAGKSIAVAQNEVQKAFQNGENKILIIRKVKADVRDSCFAQIETELEKSGLGKYVHKRRQEMRITFPNRAEILGLGLDDAERIKSIEGPTRIWVEEASEITESDFTMLDLRLRGSKDVPFQLTFTFNPTISKYHWIRERFFDGQEPKDRDDTFVLRATYKSNFYIDEQYLKVLRGLRGELRDIYEKGLFVNKDDPMQVIHSDWVDDAFERDPESVSGTHCLGVDVARGGNDRTLKCRMKDGVLVDIQELGEESTAATANNVMVDINQHGILPVDVAVDTVGLGAGTADTLKANDMYITPFIAGGSTVEDDISRESFFKFNNLRSQAWWYMRRKLQKGEIAFDIDKNTATAQRLIQDLTAPKYKSKGEKEIQVEPKEGNSNDWGIKNRLGRSTDEGDALVMCNMVHRMGNRVDYSKPLAS